MLKNLNFDKLKIIALSLIMIFIPSLKLLSYVLYLAKIVDNSFFINQVYVLWIMIPFLLILYIYGLVKKKDKINYIDIIFYILAFWGLISTIFAINKEVSILGETKRNEGLLTLISYYLIFLNCKSIKNEKHKKLLINIFLALGIFQVLYSIIQIYSKLGIVKRFSTPYLAMGLCANPNFLGSYMSMLLLITSVLFIKTDKKIYLLLSIIYNIGLTLAESSGPFLSVIFTFIFIIIYFHKKKYFKNILIILSLLLLSFLLTNITSTYLQEHKYKAKILPQYNIKKELEDLVIKIFNIKKSNDKQEEIKELGNRRVEIWYNLTPNVKEYWLTGAGLDNIKYIYPQNNSTIVDKTHNVYLQILLTNGLIPLILYCSICFIIFKKGFKLTNNYDIALYMAFIVYSIQAFLNISVIDVAPYFYIILGLLAATFNPNLIENNI